MKFVRIASLIFILLFNCLLFVWCESRKKVDVTKLNYNVINATLTLLKQHGKNQKPNDRENVKQYTCTTVVSDDELEKEAMSWIRNGKFPDEFTDNDRRVKAQYNSNDNKVHGEKIILNQHLDNLIKNMQSDNSDKKYNVYPIVVMYSYFIPCTLTNHNCSELLAKDKKKRIGTESEYSMIVGFTQSYGMKGSGAEENLRGGFRSLNEANIVAYQIIREGKRGRTAFFVVTDESIATGGISRRVFENLLYDCLRVHFVINCCAVGRNADQTEISAIVTEFVNNIVRTCHTDSQPYIDDSTRDLLQQCFQNYLNDNIKNDCTFCYGKVMGMGQEEAKLFYGQCLNQSLKTAERFKVSQDLQAKSRVQRNAKCNRRDMSPSSGCTAISPRAKIRRTE